MRTITKKQSEMAKRFSDASENLSVSQASKYINECFQLAKGEITPLEFEKITGKKSHTLRF